jgi:ferric iron reductase protein FhuF
MNLNDDFDIRTKFRLLNPTDDSSYSISVKDLFDPSRLNDHFTYMNEHSGSPTRAHAASITTKRVGYLAAIFVYIKHVHQREATFQNATMHTIDADYSTNGWLPVYSYPLQTISSEKTLVDWISNDIYAKELVPLVSKLSKEKGISRVTLFENIYTYIKWVLVDVLIRQDLFEQLLALPYTEFGEVSRHPLAFYETESNLRKTCCLSYLTVGGSKKCKTCPLI